MTFRIFLYIQGSKPEKKRVFGLNLDLKISDFHIWIRVWISDFLDFRVQIRDIPCSADRGRKGEGCIYSSTTVSLKKKKQYLKSLGHLDQLGQNKEKKSDICVTICNKLLETQELFLYKTLQDLARDFFLQALVSSGMILQEAWQEAWQEDPIQDQTGASYLFL